MTWFEVDELERERTLVFLTVSPLEQHGPHLPVGMDLFGAEYLTGRVAEGFQERMPDWEVLLTPPMPFGSNAFDFPGSLFTRQRVVRDLLVDYGASLARHGFKNIAVISVHGGTGHVVAMEEAADIVSRRFDARMIAPTGALAKKFFTGEYYDRLDRVLPRPLTEEEREQLSVDWHAGWWETSLMLLVRPDLVRRDYLELDPVLVDDYRKINDDLARTAGGGAGYLGAPSLASREFAEAMVGFLVDDAVGILVRMVGGEDVSAEARSPLFDMPFMRTDFVRNSVAVGAGVLLTLLGAIPLVDAVARGALTSQSPPDKPSPAADGESKAESGEGEEETPQGESTRPLSEE